MKTKIKNGIIIVLVLCLVAGLCYSCHVGGIYGPIVLLADLVARSWTTPTLPEADVARYQSYCLYDYNLCCLDAEDAKSTERYRDTPYTAHFRKVVGESDEQFVSATMGQLMGRVNWVAVLQNPNNYVNIWEEWTIKEIQVYVYNFDRGSTDLNKAEPEPCRTPKKILLTNNDAAVAEELSFFATNENYTISMYEYDSLYKDVLEMKKALIIRILFNESDTIAWDGIVNCYRNTETQERVLSIARSTYEYANGKVLSLDSRASDVTVQDLPALEAFLLQAVDAYRVYINQTPPTESTD